MTKFDYRGRVVNVGIDVHKKSCKVVAMMDGEILKPWTLNGNATDLAARLPKMFPGAKIRTLYEAGFCGFSLHRALERKGIESFVINASSIEVAANDRVKTDKRDARKLASILESKNTKGLVHIPTIDQELARLYQRTRAQLVEQRTLVGNQIKSKLFQFGLIDAEDDRPMCGSYLDDIAEMRLPKPLKKAISALASVWRHITSEISGVEREMEQQAESESDREEILRSVPGVGPVSSRVLSTELFDMERFKSQKSLFSFVGLTPSETSTGEKIRRGHISRQGPSRLRGILIEVAWRAIGIDKELAMIYERIKARRGGKIAIVAVARHIVGRIRTCLLRGQKYKQRPAKLAAQAT